MDKAIKIIFAIALFLITVVFNPFTVPWAYVDSTQSFSFISTAKIYFLLILNLIILILWTIKIRKTQEVRLINTPIYFALFLWILSVVISSLIFTKNVNLSFWGFNGTLENSLVENLSLVFFFFTLINNIEKNEDIALLIRAFISGLSLSFIYLIVRFVDIWQIDIQLFKDFLNKSYFSPLGHYGSTIILSLISIIFSIALIFNTNTVKSIDKNNKKRNLLIYLDIFNLIISSVMFGILLNFRWAPQYLYLILISAGIIVTLYFYVSYLRNSSRDTQNKSKLTKILISLLPLLMGLVGGILMNIHINKAQPQLINVKFDHTWSVVLDSIKQDYIRGTFGVGFGNFAHSFDAFKSESLAIPILDNTGKTVFTNFTRNSHMPPVEEIRIYQPGSIILNILYNQGLFGIVSFILIIGFSIYLVIKKGLREANFISLSSTILLIIMIVSMLFARYDFILLFSFWLILGILIISYNRDEPFYNLMIGLSSKFSFNQNLGFILPLFPAIIILIFLLITFRIFPANYFFYQSKFHYTDLDKYESTLFAAYKFFPESNLIGRELAYANAVKLDQEISYIQNKLLEINQNNDKNENQDRKEESNSDQEILYIQNRIIILQNKINQIINNLIAMHPDEYKNYFLQGIITARISEIQNFEQDERALLMFTISLSKNPFHPETHYNRSKIILRNAKSQNDFIAANNEILSSIKYRPDNPFYIKHQVDIERLWGTSVYQEIKQSKQTDKDTNSLNIAKSLLQSSLEKYKIIEKELELKLGDDTNSKNPDIVKLYKESKRNKDAVQEIINEIESLINSENSNSNQGNKK